ncbi:glycosyltransferase family 9 protein [Pontibacter sp. G13]|uniref:glycosyltransferase family 9 protein n=1 Tax=Pontibacter sp. G13 TaxID=3074898 RepID=UPI00288AC885|nr:glycosyltransferase family 9 protein [Pontibacter sp. G13]WNJ18956.1 glycosyltransferase family 9 protein [Pontibacter sp. G13]
MVKAPRKILVVRFSSIGDIVLTSPVPRNLKRAFPDCEVHYFTKAAFHSLVAHNPHIDKVHLLEDSLGDQLDRLKAEKFDAIIDLHNNLRTLRIKQSLKIPAYTFNKENLSKFWMVRLKQMDQGIAHIVDRYLQTLEHWQINLDDQGLDFFLTNESIAEADAFLAEDPLNIIDQSPMAVVLGANYATKRWLPEYFVDLLNKLGRPVVLIGGPDSVEEAKTISAQLTVPFLDTVGKTSLLVSAAILEKCTDVLAHDTGFMHIAAAFKKPIYSLWGNTVPEFGMTPYRTPYWILENQDASCRPCSKIGYKKCPRSHFECMRGLTPEMVLQKIQEPPIS